MECSPGNGCDSGDWDRRGFEAEYRRHAPRIYRFCFSRLGNEALAKDFVQEVFEQAWRQRESVDFSSRPIAPWLFGVARNLLRNQGRERARREIALNSLCALVHSHAEDPSEELARREAAQALVGSLGSLPEEQRQVVGLCLLGDSSYEAAAAALEVPVGTVRSRLNRARLSLCLAIRAADGT